MIFTPYSITSWKVFLFFWMMIMIPKIIMIINTIQHNKGIRGFWRLRSIFKTRAHERALVDTSIYMCMRWGVETQMEKDHDGRDGDWWRWRHRAPVIEVYRRINLSLSMRQCRYRRCYQQLCRGKDLGAYTSRILTSTLTRNMITKLILNLRNWYCNLDKSSSECWLDSHSYFYFSVTCSLPHNR